MSLITKEHLYLTTQALKKLIPESVATTDYVDSAISSIPTPDVSGQISTHNTSAETHADIRGAINAVSELVGDKSVSEQISNAVDNISAITTAEIDAICGASIYAASEVEV